MKSVGEVMSIGRSFSESLQKALVSLEVGLTGLDPVEIAGVDREGSLADNQAAILKSLQELSPMRILRVAEAIRFGISEEEIFDTCRIDPWFIEQIANIVHAEQKLKETGLPNDKEDFSIYKNIGFLMQELQS